MVVVNSLKDINHYIYIGTSKVDFETVPIQPDHIENEVRNHYSNK